jgi:hypothetical protein
MRAGRVGSRPALVRRSLTVVGAVLVLGGIPAASSAQDAAPAAADFIGYQSAASGTALSAFPRLPALLPVEVPFEATLSLATVTLSSGGQGFGRASSFFPGTLTAGIRPLIETAAGVRLPLPDYPLVVETREFEEAKHADVPGLTMSSDVDPTRAVAVADAGGFNIPAVVGVRSVHTESRSLLTAGKLTATSTSTLNGVDVLGVVSIGSIVSVSSVTTDGTKSTCSGGVTISGVTVAGSPATLDDSGLHVGPEAVVPGLGLGKLVSSVLAGTGLTARALDGIDACTTANGSRTTTGVLFSIPLPAIGAVPAGGGISVVLGSTSASAGASTLAATPDVGGGTTDGGLTIGDVVPAFPGGFTDGGLVVPPGSPPAITGTGGPVNIPSESTAFAYDGVPMSLLIGLALLALAGSSRLRRYMDRIIGLVGP